MRKIPPLPLATIRALRKLGEDLRTARIRRRISTALMSERAMITRPTLAKVEKGDPSVSMGIYATVIFLLGLTEKLSQLADLSEDEVGLQLADEALPKRVRLKRAKNSSKET
jgi:transcriptional regulator with XRE-family HTH domain